MSISWLLRIISGKQNGPLAAVVRFSLWCLTPVYGFVVRYRNRQFDLGSREIVPVDAKVISIGNITTGGTGKTPMVVWVCRLLQQKQIHVGIVSRGYGAKDGSQNDEALELSSRLPKVPHVQFADRVSAANRCIASNAVKAIVLDDGFQHRRLARDLDIVLIDASNPFGYDHLLPRGLLREPVSSLSRADAVVITRCDRVDADQIESTRKRIAAETSAPIALSRTTPTSLIQFGGTEISLEDTRAGKWFVFSAIGNPEAFEASLTELEFTISGSERFRDHHHFDKNELQEIASAAKQGGADRLICTHKDLVKVGIEAIDDLPVFALKTNIEIFEGVESLEKKVLDLLT